MTRFTGIPSIPIADIDAWEARFLNAIKQNLELLTNSRGVANQSNRAIVLSDIAKSQLEYPAELNLTNLISVSTYDPGPYPVVSTTGGAGSCINGIEWSTTAQTLPTTANTLAYSQDVKALIPEVDNIRNALNKLIYELQGN